MLSSHQKIKGISKRDTLADGAIHKTTLTKINHPSILFPPRNIEVGRGNPFSKGDCTPIIKSVFLCLSFLNQRIFASVKIIMTALFWRPLWSVVPFGGISTRFNAVTNTVESISDGFTLQSKGITA